MTSSLFFSVCWRSVLNAIINKAIIASCSSRAQAFLTSHLKKDYWWTVFERIQCQEDQYLDLTANTQHGGEEKRVRSFGQYYCNKRIKKGEICGPCGTHGREKNGHNFTRKTRKRPLRRPWRRWKDNIKVHHAERATIKICQPLMWHALSFYHVQMCLEKTKRSEERDSQPSGPQPVCDFIVSAAQLIFISNII